MAQTSPKKKFPDDRKWYNAKSVLGNDWAMFYFLIGGREAGKSYAITNMFCRQFIKYGRPFYWIRLTESSKKKLLNNNAQKLIDPDIRRRLNLEIETRGDTVYRITYKDKDDRGRPLKKPKKIYTFMARVLDLSTFYSDKGSGLFDADFLKDPKMYYNICLDEMNREGGEKKTFDIVYAFANQLENICRSTKERLRIICIGNLLSEASDILEPFQFIPLEFGRYYLRKKRAIVEYMKPTKAYLERRKGTLADMLASENSTFTNKVKMDSSLISRERKQNSRVIIKFGKDESQWFVLWNDRLICKYNNEVVKPEVAMVRYIDCKYDKEKANAVIEHFDLRYYRFPNITTMVLFEKLIKMVKPK